MVCTNTIQLSLLLYESNKKMLLNVKNKMKIKFIQSVTFKYLTTIELFIYLK